MVSLARLLAFWLLRFRLPKFRLCPEESWDRIVKLLMVLLVVVLLLAVLWGGAAVAPAGCAG